MTYCTIAEVKEAISFPSDGAPLADSVIGSFILDAEEEIEDIYKTKFGNIEQSGTADGTYSTSGFADSSKGWAVDSYIGYVCWIYGGTGEGQYREISANTATALTVSPVFTTAPDSTSNYRIIKLGYKNETIDGNGTNMMYVDYQPLINLNALSIDSTDVTISNVYQYSNTGKIQLSTSAEVQYFSDNNPQLIELKYIFGVYPIPRIIRRLAIVLAGIRTLTAQIAGTYDDFTSVSLPGGFTGAKGEPYMNVKASLDYLQGEARGIVYGTQSTGQVSGDFRTRATYRPWTIFG